MHENNVLNIFKQAGALLEGHFLLTSGLHSPVYWEKFRVLQYPKLAAQLCTIIAKYYEKQNIQVVVGPTTGGIILAFEVARQLGVRSAFAEKEGNTRVLRRGFTITEGERVLIVDDILTTGGSVIEVIKAVKSLEADIIGIGVMVDRSNEDLDLGSPLFSCYKSPASTYTPESCPLCAKGIPLIRLGG